jgi:hypothetical protein
MVVNQLFNDRPSFELTLKLVRLFGLKDMKDQTEFSTLTMTYNNTLTNFKIIEEEISECYIPCKRKVYLSNITNKSLISILRHFLKTQDYDLSSNEKILDGKKYLVYKIVTKFQKEKINKLKPNYKIPTKNITIVFD